MKREFEKKLLLMISADIRKIFSGENSVTEDYYDAWVYLNEVINTVADNASGYLLNELNILRDYYQNRYLVYKGLI